MSEEKIGNLKTDDGHHIAWRHIPGRGPTVVWLGGFHSDMAGTKAQFLADWARDRGQAYLRFDYYGHGESSGEFKDGTIGRWRQDCLDVIDQLVTGPVVPVGSSMGGWMASLLTRAIPDRIRGLVFIAPAPDFVTELMEPSFPAEAWEDLKRNGVWMKPSEYDDGPYPIAQTFLDDGRNWRVMDGPIKCDGPVRILHGGQDVDVPLSHGLRLLDLIDSPDCVMNIIKSGDHRLSNPHELSLLQRAIEDVLDGVPVPA